VYSRQEYGQERNILKRPLMKGSDKKLNYFYANNLQITHQKKVLLRGVQYYDSSTFKGSTRFNVINPTIVQKYCSDSIIKGQAPKALGVRKHQICNGPH
jgi:hypothetical protein